MLNEQMVSSFDGVKLYLKRNIPADHKAVVVIAHGLCEHQGRYDYLAEKFNEAGLGCYRYDHRGHGRSEGDRAYFTDWHQIVKDANVIVDLAISENAGSPVFLLGHSMGGICAELYGVFYPDKITGIILSGALLRDNRCFFYDLPADLDPRTVLCNDKKDGCFNIKVASDDTGSADQIKEILDILESSDEVASMPFGKKYSYPEVQAHYKKLFSDYFKDPYVMQTFTAGLIYTLISAVEWLKTSYKGFKYPIKIYGWLGHEIFNEYCRDEVIGDAINWILHRI